jgi:hypothetical protein
MRKHILVADPLMVGLEDQVRGRFAEPRFF